MEMLSHDEALQRMGQTVLEVFQDSHLFRRPRGEDYPGGFTWVMYEDISAIGAAASAVGFFKTASLAAIQKRGRDPQLYNEEKLAQSIFRTPDKNGLATTFEGTNYADRTDELVTALMDNEFLYGMTLHAAARGLTKVIHDIVMEATEDGEEYDEYLLHFGFEE